ncbi:ABC transporter ATP-binding protein [Acetivibrio straminisolvens]|jgi:ABC-2 type transport system ATP-binding protein|uniref:ABC transporter n=1 Tax=Acetivibrio straminisolvens JCM 21531 TaxID=1294263 RepID=W4V489_9FIRM|nr:ABC transporter ATP-binding protein [Acetivibrio straminisolvens]GAE87559.1 ABC transporter [Acetivibrio straminisolvens JCM 21531]
MTMPGEMAIEVNNLRKNYGQVKAVDGLSFSVKKGEIFGMLGPNGAGKSTTMEILVGLKNRDEGEVKVLGMDPQKQPTDVKTRIGVQLQTVFLFPRLTVSEIVKLFAGFYPSPLSPDDVIKQVGLEEKKKSRIMNLSGGQLQRVAVAVAMVSNGDIIFLDEPTSGLDPQSRRKLWEAITALKAAGKTVFLTTHYMDEAQKLCDRVAVVDHGHIIALGQPEELIKEHFQESALEFEHPELSKDKRLNELPGVNKVQSTEEYVTIYTKDIAQTIPALMEFCQKAGTKVDDVKVRQATLEDVFLKLTGRWIRE